MKFKDLSSLFVETKLLYSASLRRYVTVDFYLPKNIADPSQLSLLLINDGQDLHQMNFGEMLNELLETNQVQPIVCAGIHANRNRKKEYGIAHTPDYANRGARAGVYKDFILENLIPFIHTNYCIEKFKMKGMAGFSLGGLTALDLVWNHSEIFKTAGVFSGSLWWRSRSLEEGYVEETDRIMHQQIKKGVFKEGLKFYFTTGSLDETADRNNNGIIDSIDDTEGLIMELEKLGYNSVTDIKYINYEDGKHDVETWGRAMPQFLLWGWGVVNQEVGGKK
jgi:iron(III)-enterobactin esterase